MQNSKLTLEDGIWKLVTSQDVRVQVTLEYDDNLGDFLLTARNGVASKSAHSRFSSINDATFESFRVSLKILLEQVDFPFTLQDIPEGMVSGLYACLLEGIEELKEKVSE